MRTSPPGSPAAGSRWSMCGCPLTFFFPSKAPRSLPLVENLLQNTEMQQQLHDAERVQTRPNIVEHDSCAFRQPFETTNRKRLGDVEHTKKYKSRQQAAPI